MYLEFPKEVKGLTFQVKVVIFNPFRQEKEVDHGQKTSLTFRQDFRIAP